MYASHLKLAHHLWKEHLNTLDEIKEKVVVDATVGNGHDLIALAKMIQGRSKLIGFDIQPQAIEKCKIKIETELSPQESSNITLKLQSHAEVEEKNLWLIVYNLGYLPGGDKTITTQLNSTIFSLKKALTLLLPRGVASLTCYPGHPEGAKELEALIAFAKEIDKAHFDVVHMQWSNRALAPQMIWFQKKQVIPPS